MSLLFFVGRLRRLNLATSFRLCKIVSLDLVVMQCRDAPQLEIRYSAGVRVSRNRLTHACEQAVLISCNSLLRTNETCVLQLRALSLLRHLTS